MKRIKRRRGSPAPPPPATPALSLPPWIDRAFTTAVQHQQAGRLDEAKQLYIHILEQEPRHADAMYCLASLASQSNDLGLAADLLAAALAITEKPPYLVLLGNVWQKAGQLDQSAEYFRRALSIDSNCVDAHYNYANTLERQGEPGQALGHFERALALRPDHLEARTNLANLYRNLGRLDEAASLLELARSLAPDSMPPHINLGNVYMAQGRPQDALACFDRALTLAPNLAVLHNNRGNALRNLGRIEDALASFHRAIRLNPDAPEFHVNLGLTFQAQGRLPEALGSFRWALAQAPQLAAVHSAALFTLHYDAAMTPEALLKEHRQFGDRHEAAVAQKSPQVNSRTTDRPLRVGYVSADFRQHPVAMFTAPVFAAHDRTSLDIYCYADVAKPDSWTDTVRAAANVWRDVRGLSDSELAARIEADQIDILVDLAGHTAGNRLLVFARKPAPVQVSWLGYFNTTGLRAMDYLLVDPVISPPGEPAPFVEQPLRLDGCYLSYRGPDYAPRVSPPPSLSQGSITFGCFNTLSKITKDVVALWARILRECPGSRIVLKNAVLDDPMSRSLYHAAFARHGIAADRVVLLGGSPHAELLEHYAQVDVVLDPFPYNGGTTTCEALWMGVPVVTLAGDRFVSRVGETILHHAGCGEWIARNAEEYVSNALALAANPQRLDRERISQSPLCDVPSFTQRLEQAYRAIWRKWCESGA